MVCSEGAQLNLVVEKKAYWFQHQIRVEGSVADWQRVVGIVSLLRRKVMVRDPIFIEDGQWICLFYHDLSAEKLLQDIQKEWDKNDES